MSQQIEIVMPIPDAKKEELEDLIIEVERQSCLVHKPRTDCAAKKRRKPPEPRVTFLFDGSDPRAREKLAALINEIEAQSKDQ